MKPLGPTDIEGLRVVTRDSILLLEGLQDIQNTKAYSCAGMLPALRLAQLAMLDHNFSFVSLSSSTIEHGHQGPGSNSTVEVPTPFRSTLRCIVKLLIIHMRAASRIIAKAPFENITKTSSITR
jgi:hypothetical protein